MDNMEDQQSQQGVGLSEQERVLSIEGGDMSVSEGLMETSLADIEPPRPATPRVK